MVLPYDTGSFTLGNRRGESYFFATRKKGDKHHPLTLNAEWGTREVLWRSNRHISNNGDYIDWDHRNMTPFCNGYYTNYMDFLRLQNQALEKFDNQVGAMQQWAVDWAERRKALDLALVNAQRIVNIVSALVSRNPKRIKRLLGKSPRSAMHDVPGLWLEYNFAIKPTISGLHDAFTIMGQEFPQPVIRGIASDSRVFYEGTTVTKFAEPYFFTKYDLQGKVIIEAGLKAIKPESYLLSQTGLLNPGSMIWESIPFSWAVDYFTNAGQWISNFEPRHPGVEFAWYYTTWVGKSDLYQVCDREAANRWDNPYCTLHVTGGAISRRLVLPTYSLQLPSLDDMSAYRLANILSVLPSLMKGKQK